MYCNHRDSRHPGACRNCWRLGIVMWSIMYVGMVLMMVFHDGPTRSLGLGPLVDRLFPFVFVVGLGALIGHSIVTRWNRGD